MTSPTNALAQIPRNYLTPTDVRRLQKNYRLTRAQVEKKIAQEGLLRFMDGEIIFAVAAPANVV